MSSNITQINRRKCKTADETKMPAKSAGVYTEYIEEVKQLIVTYYTALGTNCGSSNTLKNLSQNVNGT